MHSIVECCLQNSILVLIILQKEVVYIVNYFIEGDSNSGILNCVSITFSSASKNIQLIRHKKTALKHRTSMNGCSTQNMWRQHSTQENRVYLFFQYMQTYRSYTQATISRLLQYNYNILFSKINSFLSKFVAWLIIILNFTKKSI